MSMRAVLSEWSPGRKTVGNLLAGAVLVGCLGAAAPAAASEVGTDRIFGLGVVLGEPTGGTGKLFLGEVFAFQFSGAFWFFHGRDYLQGFIDFVWHPSVITRNEYFDLPWYFGVGGGMGIWAPWEDDRHHDWDPHLRVDIRVPFGFSFRFHEVPVEAFVEFGPMMQVYDDLDVWGFIAIGGRWYF